MEITIEQFSAYQERLQEKRELASVKQYRSIPDSILKMGKGEGRHTNPVGASAAQAEEAFKTILCSDWIDIKKVALLSGCKAKRLNAFSRNLALIATREGYKLHRREGGIYENGIRTSQTVFVKLEKCQ